MEIKLSNILYEDNLNELLDRCANRVGLVYNDFRENFEDLYGEYITDKSFENQVNALDNIIANFHDIVDLFDYTDIEKETLLRVLSNPEQEQKIKNNLYDNIQVIDTVGVGGYNVNFDTVEDDVEDEIVKPKNIDKFNLMSEICMFVESNSYLSIDFDEKDWDDDSTIDFTTRENGDVGDETYSQLDVNEAVRVKKLLVIKFKTKIEEISIEGVDEWVNLSIKII